MCYTQVLGLQRLKGKKSSLTSGSWNDRPEIKAVVAVVGKKRALMGFLGTLRAKDESCVAQGSG